MKRKWLSIVFVLIAVLAGLIWILLGRHVAGMSSLPVPSQGRVPQDQENISQHQATNPPLTKPHGISPSLVGESDAVGQVRPPTSLVTQSIYRATVNESKDQGIIDDTVTEKRHIANESVPATTIDADGIALAISEYFRVFGAYPSGGNSSIFKALAGENPRKIVFLAFKHVGKNGEMLDPWGNPYEIHVAEDGRLQIRSAGSNVIMGDTDDILVEHPLTKALGAPIKGNVNKQKTPPLSP